MRNRLSVQRKPLRRSNHSQLLSAFPSTMAVLHASNHRLVMGALVITFLTLGWSTFGADASSLPTYYYGESHYNMSCDNDMYACRSYMSERCDGETHRCVCDRSALYDPIQRRCRDPYCFEHCTELGFQCFHGRCQMCWAPDGQYLCDRP